MYFSTTAKKVILHGLPAEVSVWGMFLALTISHTFVNLIYFRNFNAIPINLKGVEPPNLSNNVYFYFSNTFF